MNTDVGGIEVEAIEQDLESATTRTQFDQEKTSPSMAVIATLAEVKGVDPVEVDPLHDSIDLDALDSLVRVRDRTGGDTHITFTHDNHTITVHSYGVVTVTAESYVTAETHATER